ncbi:zinc finger, C3HC4 type [Trichuris suis]|nr:zinc finger, C3HC4 type [Trichuris suis]
MSKRSPVGAGIDLDSICDYRRTAPKRSKIFTHESERFPTCSSVGELEMHTLEAQNKKLADRLAQRVKLEEHLRKRIEDLEVRQKQDDALLCAVNRYWNQFDQDIQLLLQRLPADKAANSNNTEERLLESSESFLNNASQLDSKEFEALLARRVQESHNWGVKLIERFDQLIRGNERVQELLNKYLEASAACNGQTSEGDNSKLCDMLEIKNYLNECQRLQRVLSTLQLEHRNTSIQNTELRDQLSLLETEVNEMRSRTEDAEYKVEQAICREQKFKTRIGDLTERLRQYEERTDGQGSSLLATTSQNGPTTSVVDASLALDSQLDKQWTNDDEQSDLAQARRNELCSLSKQLQACQELIDKLRFEANHPTEDVVKETPLFRSTMWIFHLLYVELNRFAEFHKLAKREVGSLSKLHLEWLNAASELSVKDEETFRNAISFANNSWRSLVDDLFEQLRRQEAQGKQGIDASAENNSNVLSMCLEEGLRRQLGQLRGEARRWRMKFDEANSMVQALQEKLEYEQIRLKDCVLIPFTNGCHEKDEEQVSEDCKEPGEIEESDVEDDDMKSKEPLVRICALKKRLLRSRRVCRDLEVSLEALKTTNDKNEAAEKLKRLIVENRRLKCYIRTTCKQRFSDMVPELQRLNKIQMEDIARLKRSVEESKKEEQSVVTEAECTGQAYEQALEQNTILLNQIAQKDALITTQIMEVGRTAIEIRALQSETADLKAQVEVLDNLLKTHKDTEKLREQQLQLLFQNYKSLQKENRLREEQIMMNQWTINEVARHSFALKCKLENLELQLQEAQLALQSKKDAIENEQQTRRALQEEVFTLRRRLEKVKKMSRLGPRDEVLNEENRHLKELLTCPSCKVNRKDTTLLKCFHVFCSKCVKNRYDTRQRKCPKCTQAFGLNDIKRIFI